MANDRMVLSLHNEMYVVHCDNVLYMQADDHYTHIVYLSGTQFMVPFGLSDLERRISEAVTGEAYLVRMGRKFIINLRHVFHVNTVRQIVVLSDANGKNYSIPLPKPILRGIIERLGAPPDVH